MRIGFSLMTTAITLDYQERGDNREEENSLWGRLRKKRAAAHCGRKRASVLILCQGAGERGATVLIESAAFFLPPFFSLSHSGLGIRRGRAWTF